MIRMCDGNSGQSLRKSTLGRPGEWLLNIHRKEVDGGDSGIGRMVWFCQTFVNLSSLVGFLLGFVLESNFFVYASEKEKGLKNGV